MESKNYNNLVNITKQKQTYRYRKVASINKGREKRGEEEFGVPCILTPDWTPPFLGLQLCISRRMTPKTLSPAWSIGQSCIWNCLAQDPTGYPTLKLFFFPCNKSYLPQGHQLQISSPPSPPFLGLHLILSSFSVPLLFR